MQRHEWWRETYRQYRYLEFLSPDELRQRFWDVLNNIVHITPDAKLGFPNNGQMSQNWWCRFTHVLEEYELRGRGIPENVMRGGYLPKPAWPRRGKVARDGRPGWTHVLPALPEGAVVKYGQLAFLRPLLAQGRVRLCPGSFYLDTSLGPHRHDDERTRTTYLQPHETTVHLTHRSDGTPVPGRPEIPISGNARTWVTELDYYVWCVSGALEPRLFIDFDHADACLIIRDPSRFAERLGWATSRCLLSELPRAQALDVEFNTVRYYDPYLPPKPPFDDLPVPWSKPLRYAYQQEVRFVLDVLPTPAHALPVLNLTLGTLSDIAELVYIGELERRSPSRQGPAPGSQNTDATGRSDRSPADVVLTVLRVCETLR